jgi:hypothetical protein
MLLLALAVTVALVVQDQAPLRASPHEAAPRQTTLAAGDWLEVRGERQGYLQVYDHRRERPGYVRAAAVRAYDGASPESQAPKLATLVDYFRDVPGQESLGIGHAALFLRVAPPAAIGADVFDALGTMAERLGRRASTGGGSAARAADVALAAQVEVAESYGLRFARFEAEGRTQVCYDGEAFRRVLALSDASAPARVRAALGLTDPRCVDPALGSTAALAAAKWKAEVLGSVDGALQGAEVPPYEEVRLHLRRSMVSAELAYFEARSGDFPSAKQASEAAKRDLELADRSALADEDHGAYEEAALRVAAVRWASEPAASSLDPEGNLGIELTTGSPGQTCVRLTRRAAPQAPAFEHCTYAVVWPSSIRVAPHGAAVAIVLQPLVAWSELLVLHPAGDGWAADTVTPASIDPEIGYAEPAGFSPDGAHLLVAREARVTGPLGSPHTAPPQVERHFQVVSTGTLQVEKQAGSLVNFSTFRKWQSPNWQRGTLATR